MLKEIYEQPEALENALRGRLDDTESSAHFGGPSSEADSALSFAAVTASA